MRIVSVPHSCDRDAAAPPGDFHLAIEGAPAVPVRQADCREVTAGGALAAGESQMFVQTVEARGYSAGQASVQPFNVLLTSCCFIDRNRGLEVARLRDRTAGGEPAKVEGLGRGSDEDAQ